MSLEDDLSEMANQAPEMKWREKRDMIRGRFAEAANGLNVEEDRWKVKRGNGNVALCLDEVYELLFSIDESTRRVICETRPDSSGGVVIEGIGESFDLDKLTKSEVDRKIKQFVSCLRSMNLWIPD
jgi:hypothetical protein